MPEQLMPTVQNIQRFLQGLAEDVYPEDVITEGSPDQPVHNVVVCWFANRAVREAVERLGADLVVMHEKHVHAQSYVDPGCPAAEDWPINREARAFYRSRGVAVIRSHRTLDAYCIPHDFAEAIGLPPPVIHRGRKGYEYTLVYEVPATPLRELAARFKARLNLATVRVSGEGADDPVHRLGSGWGGVSLSANLQYIELLRELGVQAVIGGEVDEYAMEYYRDVGLRWIELGHYASEIIGLRRVARDLAAAFPTLRVTCHEDAAPRIAFA